MSIKKALLALGFVVAVFVPAISSAQCHELKGIEILGKPVVKPIEICHKDLPPIPPP